MKNNINILFYGTPDIAAQCLNALYELPDTEIGLVVTQPDRPAGRGNKLKASPVKELALTHGTAVLQPENIKATLQTTLENIKDKGPFDVAVVVAFGQILPKELLELPRAGSVNVHVSLLPRFRGAAPIQRAILEGDKKTGVCLMQMDEGLDTGPVYVVEEVEIKESDTGGSLHDKLAEVGGNLLGEHIHAIASGKITAKEQAGNGVTYAHKINSEHTIIDWSKSAADIRNQIRAFAPFPGALTFLDGKRFKIFKAEIAEEKLGAPGTIKVYDKHTLLVQCGKGTLSLEEVQIEGRKRMSVDSFLLGVENLSGKILSKNFQD